MKKKEISFSEYKRQRDEKKRINEASWAGLLSGLVLLTVFGYKALCEVGFRCALFTAVAAVGAALFLMGGFFPWGLRKPFALIKKAFAFVGRTVMRIILVPVYLLFSLLFLCIRPVIAKKHRFFRGKQFQTCEPAYAEYETAAYRSGRFASLSAVNNVLLFLSDNGMTILLPVVFLLLLLGLLFFFLSSHTVFSFIYTLF